jgi:hypothetical protein
VQELKLPNPEEPKVNLESDPEGRVVKICCLRVKNSPGGRVRRSLEPRRAMASKYGSVRSRRTLSIGAPGEAKERV